LNARPAAIDRTDRSDWTDWTDRISVGRDASAGSTVRRGYAGTRRVGAGRWARVRVESTFNAAGFHLGHFALPITLCGVVARVWSPAESAGAERFGAGGSPQRASSRGLRRACRAKRQPTVGRPPAPSEPAVAVRMESRRATVAELRLGVAAPASFRAVRPRRPSLVSVARRGCARGLGLLSAHGR
jgi:hypothetical protein